MIQPELAQLTEQTHPRDLPFRAKVAIGQVGPCHLFASAFPLQVPPVTPECKHLKSSSEERREDELALIKCRAGSSSLWLYLSNNTLERKGCQALHEKTESKNAAVKRGGAGSQAGRG